MLYKQNVSFATMHSHEQKVTGRDTGSHKKNKALITTHSATVPHLKYPPGIITTQKRSKDGRETTLIQHQIKPTSKRSEERMSNGDKMRDSWQECGTGWGADVRRSQCYLRGKSASCHLSNTDTKDASLPNVWGCMQVNKLEQCKLH